MALNLFNTTTLIMARKESDFRKVKDMLLDFAESIDFDLDYQSFLMELSMHETHFSPPSGASFMLITDGRVRGCICIYGIRPGIAELKRFFIYPDSATPKNMRMMLDVAIDWARQSGFRKIKLDPANSMNAAIKYYQKSGFFDIRYQDDPGNFNGKHLFELPLGHVAERYHRSSLEYIESGLAALPG